MIEIDPTWRACLEENDRAHKVYEKTVAQAQRDWEKATAPSTEALNIAIALAWNVCQETKAKSFETYNPQGSVIVV